MSLIRRNTRHLTDTVGGITGIVDLNPRRTNRNLFLDIPLLNMFEEFFNLRLFFDSNSTEINNFFGKGMRFGLNVIVNIQTERITLTDFLGTETSYIKEIDGEANTFYHSETMSKLVREGSNIVVQGFDGSISTYNQNGIIQTVLGSNNILYRISQDNAATAPIRINSTLAEIRLRRGNANRFVTCIDFRLNIFNTDVTRDFQIHFTYLDSRLVQIKYYNRGTYIQSTSINYEINSSDKIQTLELVDHNTKEHQKYIFSDDRVNNIINGISEDYHNQRSLEITNEDNHVKVVNDRAETSYFQFTNDVLACEVDHQKNVVTYDFDGDRLVNKSNIILNNFRTDPAYNLLDKNALNNLVSSHTEGTIPILGETTILRTATYVTQHINLPLRTIKPATAVIWSRSISSRNISGVGAILSTMRDNRIIESKEIIISGNDWTCQAVQIIPKESYDRIRIRINNPDILPNRFEFAEIQVYTDVLPFFEADETLTFNKRRKAIEKANGLFDVEYHNGRVKKAWTDSLRWETVENEFDNFNNVTRSIRKQTNPNVTAGQRDYLEVGASFNSRRILSKSDLAGNTTSFTYNDVQDLTRITKPTGTEINFQSTNTGLLTRKSFDGKNIDYQYDIDNNLSGFKAGSSSYTLNHTGLNELESVNLNQIPVTNFSYNSRGLVERKDYGLDNSFNFNYDGKERLSEIRYKGNLHFDYQYDETERTIKVNNRSFSHTSLKKTEFIFNVDGSLQKVDNGHLVTDFHYERANNFAKTYSFNNNKRRSITNSGFQNNLEPDYEVMCESFEDLNSLYGNAFFQGTKELFLRTGQRSSTMIPIKSGAHLEINEHANRNVLFSRATNNLEMDLSYDLRNQIGNILSNFNIGFWFLPWRHINNAVIFSCGNLDHQIKVSIINTQQLRLWILRPVVPVIDIIIPVTIETNDWSYVSVCWKSGIEANRDYTDFTIFVNGSAIGFRSWTRTIIPSVISFGFEYTNANYNAKINRAFIQLSKITFAISEQETIGHMARIYQMTRHLYEAVRGDYDIGGRVSTAVINANDYNVIPFHGSTKGLNGEQSSEDFVGFAYDEILQRQCLLATGGELLYRVSAPSNSTGFTIGLRFRFFGSGRTQYFFEFNDGTQNIGLFRKENNHIFIKINNEEFDCGEFAQQANPWNIVSISFRPNASGRVMINGWQIDHTFRINQLGRLLTLSIGREINNGNSSLMGLIDAVAYRPFFEENLAVLRNILTFNNFSLETDRNGLVRKEIINSGQQNIIVKNLDLESTPLDEFRRLTGRIGQERISFGLQSLNYRYNYDQIGNIKEIRLNDNLINSYSYNGANFLVKEVTENGTINYSYQDNGNLDEIVRNNNGVENRTSFGYQDELGRQTDQLRTISYIDKTVAITYNPDYMGNPLKRIERHSNGTIIKDINYTYVGRRLTQYNDSINNLNLEFAYNVNGLRIIKESSNQGGLNQSRYYYDGNKLIAEVNENSANSYRFDFHYDPRGLIMGFTYSDQQQNQGTFYYLRDMMLNIYGIIDSSGRRICEYKYSDAFGNHETITVAGISEVARIVSGLNPFRYKGYYYDLETGYYYLASRYYDSSICRFISADDVSFLDLERYSGLNLFVYCNNCPTMFFDPAGNFAISTLVIGILFTTLTVGTISGASNLITAVTTGQDPWAAFASGFVNGAISGLGLGVGLAIGGPFGLLATVGFGFLGGYSGSIINSQMTTGRFDLLNEMHFMNGAVSAMTNLIFFGIGSALNIDEPLIGTFGQRFAQALAPNATSFVVNGIYGGVIGLSVALATTAGFYMAGGTFGQPLVPPRQTNNIKKTNNFSVSNKVIYLF
ncbi:MAG: RHS repeat-associated core domain-containing protein [Erysipelotrichales bacterium]|nr:RHS repeat-associated core domain-containing protein [Erysipelotrichales bacterium]